jgi:hypothetical protein
MANKKLFQSATSTNAVVPTNTVNNAGGAAYSLSAEASLAQYASMGTFVGKERLLHFFLQKGKCLLMPFFIKV